MNRLTASALSAALLLALLAGCPGPEPAADATAPGTNLMAGEEICETLPPVDSVAMTAADSTAREPKPEPKPEPRPEPEPPPKPRVLPRMWDFGSTNCLPCKEMEKILHPMMEEYQGKVDIRIVNVYEEQSLAQQARVQMIPTQVFYDPEGSELFRHVGVYPRDSIVAKFREFGWD